MVMGKRTHGFFHYIDTGPHLEIFRRVPNIPSSVYDMPISSSSSWRMPIAPSFVLLIGRSSAVGGALATSGQYVPLVCLCAPQEHLSCGRLR
jgi:hypothetical protein